MTSFEVIDNMLRGKPAERVGFNEALWADTLKRWMTEGYPTEDVDGEERPVDPVDALPYDMSGAGGGFDVMPHKGVSDLVDETDEWAVRRNGAGAALKYWKNRSGTPEHIDFWMTNRDIWDKEYRPHLTQVDRGRLDIEGTKKTLAKRRKQGY